MSNTDQEARLDIIRTTAARFCKHFVSGASPDEILAEDFTKTPKITEYGPEWAKKRLPFLGQPWSGRAEAAGETSPKTTCDDYFNALGATLNFHPTPDSIPPEDDFIVSAGKGPNSSNEAVLVRAKADLSSVTAQGPKWEDKFVFLFSEFDNEGRIGHLEIWSDGLSAWTAVGEK